MKALGLDRGVAGIMGWPPVWVSTSVGQEGNVSVTGRGERLTVLPGGPGARRHCPC
jgi:hypothetical protein